MCLGPVGKAVNGLLVIQAFRPDRLIAMARIFVEKALGTEFVQITERELDLGNIVETEVCGVSSAGERSFVNLTPSALVMWD